MIYLRNNFPMPGCMLILIWIEEPGIRELFFDSNGIYGNFMHSSVPRQRLFLGAVPITSHYYLQDNIMLQKLFQLPPVIIYKNI